MMDVPGFIEQLRVDGERLGSLAGTTDPAADVPTCPGWTLADLLHHLGGVHRWATGFVRGAGRQPEDGDLEAFVGGWPPDERLETWFREGHGALVEALASAPADLEAWTFLAAPSPLAFWARRQAHETAIHRIDGESAVGSVTGVPAPFAVDGIDELLLGFASRPRAVEVDRRRSMTVRATDVDRAWSVRFDTTGLSISKAADAHADASVRGSAAALYRALWNRGIEDVAIEGDEDVAAIWAATVRVTWS